MTNSLYSFFLEVIEEVKKIQWPTSKDFFTNVFWTLIIVLLFSIFFGIVDNCIGYALMKIIYAFV